MIQEKTNSFTNLSGVYPSHIAILAHRGGL